LLRRELPIARLGDDQHPVCVRPIEQGLGNGIVLQTGEPKTRAVEQGRALLGHSRRLEAGPHAVAAGAVGPGDTNGLAVEE